MMYTTKIPNELKEDYIFVINEARKDRPKYFDWIKNEIEIVIGLINKFDKHYILGGLGARLIECVPTIYNQFISDYEGPDMEEVEKDKIKENDEIEVLLEYALSIATASPNNNQTIPSQNDIDLIYDHISKIKANINIWELSSDDPIDGNEYDYWLRINIIQNSINVRGTGYQKHLTEVYREIFEPHNGFLEQYYGFNSNDIYDVVLKLDSLVYSKIDNLIGALQSHQRFREWMKATGKEDVINVTKETGSNSSRQFIEANPDLYDEADPDHIFLCSLDDISSYRRIFWVIPKSKQEELIFDQLSQNYGDNSEFFQPAKFKAFPLNDSLIKSKPLIKENNRYYHFSTNLPFRNIFKITENLLKSADQIYYDNYFRGNSNYITKDNYVERKTKLLFEKLIPNAKFYHSLDYEIVEDGLLKRTELDILGLSNDSAYIIEVKAGELNMKHRKGALKGLKDRLGETINKGSYQCHRALKHINSSESPSFEYIEDATRKTLTIDKTKIKKHYKISITFEHFAAISANLRYLISSNVLSPDFKWTWIVSLYDLMVFSDLIESEDDFKEYIDYRIDLYERNNIEFHDEIDILGFFMEGNFPLKAEDKEKNLFIIEYKNKIEEYYTKTGVGMPFIDKPKRKR